MDFIELDKAVGHVIGLASCLWLWFQSVCPLISLSDIFKKIRDTKGTFHAKMSSVKDRNDMDLTEAEDIKKRRQKYTEELYKKQKTS